MILADKILKYGFSPQSDDDGNMPLLDPGERREAKRARRAAQQGLIQALRRTDPKVLTERFVFETDMLAALVEFDRRTKGDKRWSDNLRIPADALWIEWKVSPDTLDMVGARPADGMQVQTGILMEWTTFSAPYVRGRQKPPSGWLLHQATCVESDAFPSGRNIDSSVVMTECSNEPPADQLRVHWAAHSNWRQSALLAYDLLSYCVFLLTQPRTYELRHVSAPPKLVAARLKDRKPPPLEYKAITFHPGAVQVRYEKHPRDPNAPHETRRLHSVIGHWRHYDDGALSWIPYHWRGDRKKGVVIHERHVEP